MDDKTVSVIIPAYNVERYIENCLLSVQKQTYRNLQVIVVDDGSVDDTLRIATSFAKKTDNVSVIHKENGGVSAARNMALDIADGDYIYFVDPDDELEVDTIEKLVTAMESSDYDWVSCQYSRWDEAGKRLDDYNFVSGDFSFYSDEDRLAYLTGILLKYLSGFEVWDKLFCAEIISNNKIRFPEKIKIGEDLCFNIKYLMAANKLISIDDRVYRCTIRQDSAMSMHKKLTDIMAECIKVLEEIWSFYQISGNAVMLQKFPCILVMILDNSYRGHTPLEVSEALLALDDITFLRERYKGIDRYKREIICNYPRSLARIKFRYHMYVRSMIDHNYRFIRVHLFFYNIYRSVVRNEPLKDWKML